MSGKALSLRTQLLTAFVVLVIGTTVALTVDAYRSSLENLEADARQNARAMADARADALERTLAGRQARAQGFLVGARETCGEQGESGRYGWALDCVRPMLAAFRAAEGASGATLMYGGVHVATSGAPISRDFPSPTALARVSWVGGEAVYVMQAREADLEITVQFPGAEITGIFGEAPNLGQRGEILLIGPAGRFLTRARFGGHETLATPPGADIEPVRACLAGPGETLDVDYRGIKTVHAFRPVPELEGACVDAHVNYDEAMEPAERLRARLLERSGLFIIAGALFSLIASYGIAAPVRRLALAARELHSRLDVPIPIGGPSEIRALGQALRESADDLAALVSREQAARHEAQAANSAKDQFLAAVSHELRTPLTAILGWARVMRSHQDARSERALDAIERSAQAQSRLIEDLLDVSRIVAGQMRIERESIHLPDVVERALDAIRPQAHEKNIEIQTTIEDAVLTVAGDPERLQQVVWNLVANSVKFTSPGGSILVSLKRVNEQAQLSVRDNGAGIPKSFLPHVFDWFRQGVPPPDRAPSGLGLGLGIVRQIVEIHGGTVRAESEGTGRGARFIVTLPIEAASDSAWRETPIVPQVNSSFGIH